jgi:hypothetical protein
MEQAEKNFRQSTDRTKGCSDSLDRGKLPQVETPSSRLSGRGSPRACRSPDPPPTRPYTRCVGRPAFLDSSDLGISVNTRKKVYVKKRRDQP